MQPIRQSAAVLVFALLPFTASAVTFLTETNPPFNRLEGKSVVGLSTEVVTEMAKRAGVPAKFELGTWDVMYSRAQADKEACLYSTARELHRETLFQWVGPIATNAWALYAKQGFTGKVESIKDAARYRIAAVVEDAKSQYLREKGATFLVEALKDEQNPPKLTTDPKATGGKVDLWVTGAYQAKAVAENAGVKDIKKVFNLRDVDLWLACSPRLPKATVEKLQDALAAMKRDGSFRKIQDRYSNLLVK
ncbi:MAG: transporter substrate-binding domain-containing protein [Burkholderiales bacterium]|nr:transporter substrate-binding domain-containing protein [Burkholderiales bacterium]